MAKKKSIWAEFKDTAVTEKQLAKIKVPKTIVQTKSGFYADLYKEYKVLAKRADTRLRSLEKLQHVKGYENVTKWAYSRAVRDIKTWSGEKDIPTFNTKAPATTQGLKAKIEDIKNFLESATSSKTKIKTMYSQRAKDINKEYGTNLKWDDMANVFESETWTKLKDEYKASDTIMLAFAAHANNGVIPDLSESKEHKHISEGVKNVVDDILKKHGAELDKLKGFV